MLCDDKWGNSCHKNQRKNIKHIVKCCTILHLFCILGSFVKWKWFSDIPNWLCCIYHFMSDTHSNCFYKSIVIILYVDIWISIFMVVYMAKAPSKALHVNELEYIFENLSWKMNICREFLIFQLYVMKKFIRFLSMIRDKFKLLSRSIAPFLNIHNTQ